MNNNAEERGESGDLTSSASSSSPPPSPSLFLPISSSPICLSRGSKLISLWQNSEQLVCSSPSSSLYCSSIILPHMPPKTPPHSYCYAYNISIFPSHYQLRSAPKYRSHYFLGGANELYSYDQRGGLYQMNCQWAEMGKNKVLEMLSADHMRDHIDGVGTGKGEGENPMAPPTQAVTLLIVTREGSEYANLYHSITDIYNTFIMVKMKRLLVSPSPLQLLLSDNHPPGPFDSLWKTLFSPNYPLLRPSTMHSESDGKDNVISNSYVIFIPPGYSSPLYMNLYTEDQCEEGVDSLVEFSDFVRKQLGIKWDLGNKYDDKVIGKGIIQHIRYPSTVSSPPHSLPQINILFISRRPYISFVDHKKINRRIFNEEKLLIYLNNGDFPHANHISVEVAMVEFSTMTFNSQLSIIANTDILIGAHGAALSHSLFLPPTSVLLELNPIHQQWKCFEHFAKWSGHEYLQWRNGDATRERVGFEVNEEEFKQMVNTAIESVVKKRKMI